jgi:O-antigen/teichoic acid export membrane protein
MRSSGEAGVSAIREASLPVIEDNVRESAAATVVLSEEQTTAEHVSEGLKVLAIRGTAWTLGSYAAGQLLRLIGNIVLTRLLVPQYFGLMTLVNSMIVGFTLFSDLGVNGSVTRDPHGDKPEFLNTAWTMQILRGFLLWGVCIAFARPAANFYHDPRLSLILPLLGLTTVFTGFSSIRLLTLVRDLALRELAIFEIAGQILQHTVTIVWALFAPSVWALVGGRLVADLVKTLAGYLLLPGYHARLGWDRRSVASILQFGKWIFVAGAVYFLASQSDRLVIGHLVSLHTLALYGIAFTLADIPRQVIIAFSGRIAFPFISKFVSLPRSDYRAVILRNRRMILILAALGIAVVVNVADLLYTRIYDSRYWPSAWMIPFLALGLWHTVLYSTSSPALVALGKSFYNAAGYSLSAMVLYLGVPVAFHHYGMVGAVVVVAFSDVPMYFVNLYGLWKERIQTFSQDLQATLLFLIICSAGAAIRIGSGLTFPNITPLR